jgi:hypothetical protein
MGMKRQPQTWRGKGEQVEVLTRPISATFFRRFLGAEISAYFLPANYAFRSEGHNAFTNAVHNKNRAGACHPKQKGKYEITRNEGWTAPAT